MSVFNSHMKGSYSVISNKPKLYIKKHIRTIKAQKACVTNKNIRLVLTKKSELILKPGFFKENVSYPVWTCRDPIFSDSRAESGP